MKLKDELIDSLMDLSLELSAERPGWIIDKEKVCEKIAKLVAVTEVFTDLNFTEEEQAKLFNISAQRHKELKEKLK